MRVLVACEFSGIVRDAFIAAGHDAVSCDLLPSERPGPHIIGDALEVAESDLWDTLLAFPPCTFLCNSGARWLYGGKGTVRDPDRWASMEDAADFFATLLCAPVPRIAVENPVMHHHGRDRIAELVGDTVQPVIQPTQPWMFGHGETKQTNLWLVNLPPLVPTELVDGRRPRVHHASPSPDRWRERSRTMPGLAAAMAAQWGVLEDD